MSNISDLLSIFDSGEYTKFLENYSNIVNDENETDNLITAKGIAYLRTGEPEKAVENFNKLLAKNNNNKEAIIYKTSAGNLWMQACLETGNDLLSSGDMQEAYEIYSQINLNEFVNLNKNLVFQLCNNLAVCLLNLGRAEEALEAFTSTHLLSSLEDDTNSPISMKRRSDTALNKAIILKSLNRLEEALIEFDLCLNHQPDNLTAICGKSEILSSIGRYEEAVQIVTDTIEVYPLDNTITDITKITQIISLWVARGFASIKLNLFNNAINDFNYVLSLTSTPPFSNIISSNETSIKEAQRLRNICLGYYADNLLNSGEIAKAIETYNEVIEIMGGIDNTSINILFNRAYAYYQLATNSPENLEEAIQGFQIVVKKDPRHFQGQTGLGQALLNKADAMAAATDDDVSFQQEPIFLAAIDSLKQAHLLDPSDTQILYNLALTLLRTNQAEAAASKFRLLLSLTPDSENAAKGLALSEQMLLDNSRVEALKKKRAEAAAKTANNNNNNNNTPVAAPAPAPSPSGSNSRTSAPNIPSPSPSTATSLESLHSTPIKSDTFTKVSSPTVSLTSSNTTVSTPPAQSVSRSNITTSSPSASSASSSEPKSESGIRDLLSQIRSDSIYYSLSSLKSPGPYPDGVHHSHRELYLSEDEFKLIFGSTKEEFLAFPQWKQVSKKKGASLF